MPRLNTILLVDDDEITNFIHRELINDLNICDKVVLAENGNEALSYISKALENNDVKSLPDYIFLDINMPEMDGMEFIRQLNRTALPTDPKVIVMLTTTLESTDKSILEDSKYVKGFKEKPLTAQEIVNLISKENSAI